MTPTVDSCDQSARPSPESLRLNLGGFGDRRARRGGAGGLIEGDAKMGRHQLTQCLSGAITWPESEVGVMSGWFMTLWDDSAGDRELTIDLWMSQRHALYLSFSLSLSPHPCSLYFTLLRSLSLSLPLCSSLSVSSPPSISLILSFPLSLSLSLCLSLSCHYL